MLAPGLMSEVHRLQGTGNDKAPALQGNVTHDMSASDSTVVAADALGGSGTEQDSLTSPLHFQIKKFNYLN